ncbi:MAG: PAS domain S-box protein [Alphaproteobacteria bacterium]|nr:PAS domain S-box protein [Alphaproteobacteria bacterium]MBL7096542.1 PAS domain S-box protein [Alphaproteobacteria bacterium]
MGLADTAGTSTAAPIPSVPGPDAALHYAAIVQSSDDAIISKDLNGIITSWNKGAERLFGWRAEEIIGRSVLTLIPADRHDEEPGILGRIHRGERIEHYETVRQRKDGSLVDISLTVSPIRDVSGKIIGASKIARDITERKRAEEARELLLHEIKHRVKNTLGTVQAIATQTFRSAPKEERAAFVARLHALADAHDLLTQQNWSVVGVRETVQRALAPFQQRDRQRFTLTGGDLQIASTTALLLAMIIHELGTNAVKYGAFAADGGRVAVEWCMANGRLKLFWSESGGPPVVAPTRRGFGTQMIERTLRGEQGAAKFDYAPGGLKCSLEIRL